MLSKTGERLVVSKDEAVLLDLPVAKVEGVLVFGQVQVTTAALHLLLGHNVELALFTRRGRLLGQLTSPFTKNIDLRRAQYARAGDADFVLTQARAIVAGKLANCLELLRDFDSHDGIRCSPEG